MQVQVSIKHKMVGVPLQPDVINLFPNAKQATLNGQPLLVVPHGLVETCMLRKLGIEVPHPIEYQYDWAGGKPFAVQVKTCSMLSLNPRAYVLNDMGSGKTKSALWAFDYLRGNNFCKKMLVVAPLSTLNFTWAREAFNTLPHRKCVVLHGSRQKRLERLKDPDAEIFVINHDGVSVIADEIKAMVAADEIDVLVIDELAVYRNNSERTQVMRDLAQGFKWVWGMTGTPIPHEPTDVWSQCTIVTPTTIPKYFGWFRDSVMTRIITDKGQTKWVPKPDAEQRAFEVMQPAVRYTLDDVTELPECVKRTLDIDLGPKQKDVYSKLVAASFAAIQNKEIKVVNGAAMLTKLLQVSTGWVYASDGRVVALDNGNRIEALVDMINSAARKVIVFAPFKHALHGISEALKKEGIDHAVVSGDTSPSNRNGIFTLFQQTGRYKVLVAHPQCLAHGVTLTAADTVVWFGPVLDYGIYDQANHRVIRIGQEHKQLILHLQATAVERKVYRMIQQKQNVQDKLLELFEQATE
jgi:SNF2 family DNA or RNA helicase